MAKSRKVLPQDRKIPCENAELKKLCGCTKCDCELSLDDYHKGCHSFNLHDQFGDSTNSTESGGLYDEEFGPQEKGKFSVFQSEELEYFGMH